MQPRVKNNLTATLFWKSFVETANPQPLILWKRSPIMTVEWKYSKRKAHLEETEVILIIRLRFSHNDSSHGLFPVNRSFIECWGIWSSCQEFPVHSAETSVQDNYRVKGRWKSHIVYKGRGKRSAQRIILTPSIMASDLMVSKVLSFLSFNPKINIGLCVKLE